MNRDAPHPPKRGRRLRLSLQRRWIGDIVAAAITTPTGGVERTARVGEAVAARRAVPDPPGWTAIILKAYAIVAARRPDLRRVYLSFPWPHLYEHPSSVATVVIERTWRGEPGVFVDQILKPETMPLREINSTIGMLARAPIESIGGYRRLIRFSRLPRPLRRVVWWVCRRCSGYLHARYFGTFAMNSVMMRRTGVAQSLTPLTMQIVHMPLEMPCQIRIYAIFDHRVVDGMTVGRALGEIEAVMNREITDELWSLSSRSEEPVAAAQPGKARRRVADTAAGVAAGDRA